MADSKLLINCMPFESRVALVENDQVVQLYIERENYKGIVGNIYKGKVLKVLPGLQAAFVDIGCEKAAFLYVNEVVAATLDQDVFDDLDQEFDEDLADDIGATIKTESASCVEEEEDSKQIVSDPEITKKKTRLIQDVLEEGKEIIVQVKKDSIGSKGPRLTTYISLPGRYLVYMPNINHIGVSRRIENEKERERVLGCINDMGEGEGGFIVRTASEGVGIAKLKSDHAFLTKLWQDICRKAEKLSAPSLIYTEVSIALRAARDLFTKDVDRLIIDSKQEYQKLIKFINAYLPRFRKNVEFYEREEPIFAKYGIDLEVARALGSKVWLKSGGYIIIEETEALTSIDVNTGRYKGHKNLEETSLLTNLEASKEIALQVRLRNIGGIIIVDFIDMEKEEYREKVFTTLCQAFQSDRAKVNILPMSEIGLIQMTRKRVRESIGKVLTEKCPICEGLGRVKSSKTLAYSILQDVYSACLNEDFKNLNIITSKDVMNQFYSEENIVLDQLEKNLGIKVKIESKENVARDYYEFILE